MLGRAGAPRRRTARRRRHSGCERGQFLHAGPRSSWERASGPLRGALIGAMLFEGLAATPDEAEARAGRRRRFAWEPCHDRGAVGPMAGVVSPSMWMFELRDEANRHTRRGAR